MGYRKTVGVISDCPLRQSPAAGRPHISVDRTSSTDWTQRDTSSTCHRLRGSASHRA